MLSTEENVILVGKNITVGVNFFVVKLVREVKKVKNIILGKEITLACKEEDREQRECLNLNHVRNVVLKNPRGIMLMEIQKTILKRILCFCAVNIMWKLKVELYICG
jgi:hypothetical protein